VRGKKANHVSLKLISLRLDKDVYDYLVEHYPTKIQATIRAVLKSYVTKNGERNDTSTNDI
jgi:uncharacterized protein (DUF4415 family)